MEGASCMVSGSSRTKFFTDSARRYRWVVWSVMALAYMVVFFHRLAPGVVRDDLTLAFGISGAAFGNFASMYFYSYLLMQIPVGMLSDSLGARITATAGIFLSGIGSILFGLAPSIGWAYAGRFIVGIGVSTVFVCILKVLSEWYSGKEFATMSGATAFVGNFGGLVAQTPLALLVGIFTWRFTFAAIGALSFLLAVLCFVLIRNRPEDAGFDPVNLSGPGDSPPMTELFPAVRVAICSRAMWPTMTLASLFAGAQLAFTGAWGVPWLTDVYEMTRQEASGLVSIVVVGAMIGGVLVGKLSDLVGARRWPLIFVSFFNVAAWGVIVFWGSGKPPLEVLKPALFIMGVASMALVVCLAVVKETNDPRYTGVALSVLNMGVFVGIAAYPPAMGAVIDFFSSCSPIVQYRWALFLCFAGAAAGFILSFAVPETGCQNVAADRSRPPRG